MTFSEDDKFQNTLQLKAMFLEIVNENLYMHNICFICNELVIDILDI